MTETPIPPCGPERDRLVAEAVGWDERPTIRGEVPRAFEHGYGYRYPSSDDADALAALKAWKAKDHARRTVVISLYQKCEETTVHLFDESFSSSEAIAGAAFCPTLADAATAALARWRNERSNA